MVARERNVFSMRPAIRAHLGRTVSITENSQDRGNAGIIDMGARRIRVTHVAERDNKMNGEEA
jgi:hypothetical protein